jgi:transcription antitermination factor NusG
MDWEGPTNLHWFALHVRTNHEKTVQQLLEQKRFESFLPTYRERRSWSDRVKYLDRPLFPGYVFCRLNPNERTPAVKTPNVIQIVGSGKTPIAILDSEITSLKTIIDSRISTQPWPFLRVGQKVRIERGPLAGVEGILQTVKTRYRIVVSISLLQRSVAAEMDGSWVSAVSDSRSGTLMESPVNCLDCSPI